MFYFECETGICSGHYQASLFSGGGFIIRCENFSGKTCFPVLLSVGVTHGEIKQFLSFFYVSFNYGITLWHRRE